MTADPGYSTGPFTTDWAADAEDDVAPDADTIATGIVLALLGNRWTWPAREVMEDYRAPARRIHLAGRPVSVVTSVTDSTGAAVSFRLVNGHVLQLDVPVLDAAGGLCPCVPSTGPYTVVYTYGSQPPMAVRRAITVLGEAIDEVMNGCTDCRLPDRIVSINRQGVSWTLIDPQEFLEMGRTGIIEVDMVLSAYNRGAARSRARVWSPEFPPPDRIDQGS